MTTIGEACFLCDRICVDKCPDCGQVFTCSPQHLQVHRGGKKCLPWVVKFQEGVGRALVASRDILPFELVMEDDPLVKVVGADEFCVNCGEKSEGIIIQLARIDHTDTDRDSHMSVKHVLRIF